MPHIHLFTSADLVENVDIPDILKTLVEALSRQETIDSRAVKAYHSMFHTWTMGAGAPAGFAHCSVAILEGRSPEVRVAIAEAMYEAMRQGFHSSLGSGEVALTVEVREMARDTYRKPGQTAAP